MRRGRKCTSGSRKCWESTLQGARGRRARPDVGGQGVYLGVFENAATRRARGICGSCSLFARYAAVVDATYYEQVSRELIRAVRGRRSQLQLSLRAGYKSNMIHRWEAGECMPTAAAFLRVCERQQIDVAACFAAFYGRSPAWLAVNAPASNAAVAGLVLDLKGKVPITELAERVGRNRYTVGRWLKGQIQVSLPDLLQVLDACGQRMLDFIATLTDPKGLASVRTDWEQLQRAKEIAYDEPRSHAVLRALELDAYQRSGWKRPGWLARKVGLPKGEVERLLQELVASGQARVVRGRYKPQRVIDVNTGQERERAQQVKLAWTRESLQRLEASHPGLFGYLVFATSRENMKKLRQLQLEYVGAMRSLIANSTDANECVGLFCTQLMDLDVGPRNALNASSKRTKSLGGRRHST